MNTNYCYEYTFNRCPIPKPRLKGNAAIKLMLRSCEEFEVPDPLGSSRVGPDGEGFPRLRSSSFPASIRKFDRNTERLTVMTK